jgi:hypothetical protein
MNPAQNSAETDVSDEILPRLVRLWDAWRNKEADTHNDVLAHDYRAVHPDGTLHIGKPTLQTMTAEPIAGYELARLSATSLGADSALVTYVAKIDLPGGNSGQVQLAVGEVWMKQQGQWMCRYYQGTLMK